MDVISTGSFDLNDFLGGGYERGVVTMVVGPPGSGKTNLSILAACSSAKDGRVVFIDTEGGFSVDRVMQIVGEKKFDKIISNISILNPMDFSEQEGCFEKINKYLKKGDVDLVVVDSIVMLYRLELGIANSLKNLDRVCEVNSSISNQMRNLVEIVRKRNIPVIITNQVYGNYLSFEDKLNGVDKDTFVVGGDLFRYWSKCIIELKKGLGRKMILLKHRSLPVKEISFEIRDAGIFRKKGIF
jgi:DNA repair protein RadB